MTDIRIAYKIESEKFDPLEGTGRAKVHFVRYELRKDLVLIPAGQESETYPEPSDYKRRDYTVTQEERILKTIDPDDTGRVGFAGYYNSIYDFNAYLIPETNWKLLQSDITPVNLVAVGDMAVLCISGSYFPVGPLNCITVAKILSEAMRLTRSIVMLDIGGLCEDGYGFGMLFQQLRSDQHTTTARQLTTETHYHVSGFGREEHYLIFVCDTTTMECRVELKPSHNGLSKEELEVALLDELKYRTIAGRCVIPDTLYDKIKSINLDPDSF